MEDRRKQKEKEMTLKIASEPPERYRRHAAYDAKNDKETSRKSTRASSKVVAVAQTTRKKKNVQPLGKEKDISTQAKTKRANGGKRKKKSREETDENMTASTAVVTGNKLTEPRTKGKTSSKRTKTAMEMKAATKSGVIEPTDSFGCRHLGVTQLFCMSVAWYKKFLEEGEFLYGKKCSGDSCNKLKAEDILGTQGKSKIDGSVLYYCDEGCKAIRSDDPTVVNDLECDFFLCRVCYFDRIEKMESSTRSKTDGGGRRRSGRAR